MSIFGFYQQQCYSRIQLVIPGTVIYCFKAACEESVLLHYIFWRTSV